MARKHSGGGEIEARAQLRGIFRNVYSDSGRHDFAGDPGNSYRDGTTKFTSERVRLLKTQIGFATAWFLVPLFRTGRLHRGATTAKGNSNVPSF